MTDLNFITTVKQALSKFDLEKQYDKEADLLSDVNNILEYFPPNILKKMRIVDNYTNGYSDLFLCICGKFCVIELKDKDGTPRRNQLAFIKEVKLAGGFGGVAATLKEVMDIIWETYNAVRYQSIN